MSQENVETIQRMYGRAQHDPAALMAILDDEVEFDVTYPEGQTFRGPEGVAEYFRRWVGAFEDWGYEVGEVIDAGDSVVACIRQWGRGRSSGVAVDHRFWQVWTMRNGKAIRVTHHAEKAEALVAVGLSE
jgi:ketosteroid isomerase-like protein